MSDRRSDPERRNYTTPKVVHTEKMTTRAVVCAQGDDADPRAVLADDPVILSPAPGRSRLRSRVR
jgi:hypothetical protein